MITMTLLAIAAFLGIGGLGAAGLFGTGIIAFLASLGPLLIGGIGAFVAAVLGLFGFATIGPAIINFIFELFFLR